MKPISRNVALMAAMVAAIGAVIAVVLLEALGAGAMYEVMLYFPGVDKALHLGQSFLISVGVAKVFRRMEQPLLVSLTAGAAIALIAAGFDEWQQSFRPDRQVDLADVGAGVAGVALAAGTLLRSSRPQVAVVLAAIGVASGALFIADSYQRTRSYNRGVLAERAGRRAEALQHYVAAAAEDPRNPEVYNAAAWLIAESDDGDPLQAVTLAEQSLRLRPGHPDTLDTYGWSLYRAGRAADAVSPLIAALSAKPDIYCIHYHLGVVYLQLDRRDEGVRHLQLQIVRSPSTREAELARGLLARLQKSEASR
jgi:tetratricopeptide (TPR) repeat protein